MRANHRPLILVEGPAPLADAHADASARRLRSAGFELVEGFRSSRPVRPTVCRGTVVTDADAGAAVLAALAGNGLLVVVAAPPPTADRLLDDLRRVGTVDHRTGLAPDAPPPIGPQARALLGLLAEGVPLGEAAARLGIARRTADRRLAEARHALGADRTSGAVRLARQAGWLSTAGVRPRD